MRILAYFLPILFSYLATAKPIIIGHRGASGYLPEHTVEAYTLAIEQGADFIEPDVVITKDGHLIARHEHDLSETTDVQEKFPERKTTITIYGKEKTGWFSENFTLAEIKTLKALQRLSFRDQSHNGKYSIPTLDEVVKLASQRGVGVYPETKTPAYFRSIGLPLEEKLIATLSSYKKKVPVFIQSFEPTSLKRMKKLGSFPLIQLIWYPNSRPNDGSSATYGEMLSDMGSMAKSVAGIGVSKRYVRTRLPISEEHIVKMAHKNGLKVHVFTFRNENKYLPTQFKDDPIGEYRAHFNVGVDGVFSDFPDTAQTARQKKK